jgi:hypothetical protein
VSQIGEMKLKIQFLSAKTEDEWGMSVGSSSARVRVEKRVRSCKVPCRKRQGKGLRW